MADVAPADPTLQTDQRKAHARELLGWIKSEVAESTHPAVIEMNEILPMRMYKNALQVAESTGNRLPPEVLLTLDGTRLNLMHLAASEDTGTEAGRRRASDLSLQAAKFMQMENDCLERGIFAYCSQPSFTQVGPKSREDRAQSAGRILSIIGEYASSTRDAERDFSREPMIRALQSALTEVRETGAMLSVPLGLSLYNNAMHKKSMVLTASTVDKNGDSQQYFSRQAACYHQLASLCTSSHLITDMAPARDHTRAR